MKLKENGFSFVLNVATLTSLALSAVLLAATPASAKTLMNLTTQHRAGELLVQLKDDGGTKIAQGAAFGALAQKLGARSVLNIRTLQTSRRTHVVRLAKDSDMDRAIAILKAEPAVEIAEPNYIYQTFNDTAPVELPALANGMPNDPDLIKTWGLSNSGQTDAAGQVGKTGSDINVAPLWQAGIHGSRKVLVAVIDTGVDWTHPDLVANLYTNAAEAKGAANVDDDKNGFVDDLHGWNFAAHTNQSQDDHSHGSHCSGTIGGVGNNGKGVVGVNWEVSILPVKFLDAQGGGSLDAALESINYATMMKVNVMSNSWGGGGYSESLKQSIQKARDAGILFVAAAGNDSSDNDARPSYPASYDLANVVSVAATDNRDGIASFSNYGTRTVHVAAPGVKVYSTVKGGAYDTYSGTSMATPHVAGIAALLLSANPGWSYSELKDRLIKTSDPVSGLRRKVASHGRVNAYNAFHGIVPPSSEPDPSLWKTEPLALESVHPYTDNLEAHAVISRPGAKFIRVHFAKIDTEANYDHVKVVSGAGEVADDVSGLKTDYLSEYVQGEKAEIVLKADESNPGWGYQIDSIQVIY